MIDSTGEIKNAGPGPPISRKAKGNPRFSLLAGLLLAGLSVGSAYLAFPTAESQGPLAVDVAVRDLGSVRQGAVLETSFELTNRGRDALDLLEVRKSCTCTNTAFDRSRISPGDSARLNVTVTIGANRGSFASRLSVIFADASHAEDDHQQALALIVKATVSPDVEFEPQMLTFSRSSDSSRNVRIYSKWLSGPLILRAQAGHRAFRARALEDGTRVEVSFNPALWPKDENPLTDLVVTTPSKAQPDLRIPIRVLQSEDRT